MDKKIDNNSINETDKGKNQSIDESAASKEITATASGAQGLGDKVIGKDDITVDKKTAIDGKSPTKASKNTGKVAIIVGVALILVMGVIYVFASNYYTEHFYVNTKINGVSVSNKTPEKVEEEINNELKSYTLTLEGRDGSTEVISGYNIDISTVFDDSLEKQLASQKGYDWPLYLFEGRDISIETMIAFDEELFDLNFNNLDFLNEELVTEPANAFVDDYDGTSFNIVAEVQGNKVKEDVLYNVVSEGIHTLEEKISLEEINAYEEPTVYQDDPELMRLVEDMNKLTTAEITYEFGDTTEVVDGNKISEWLIIDDNNQVNIDPEGVKGFVDYIGSTYNTFGKTRTLKTSYGPTIEVRGGDYGWWLNRGKEIEELTDLIKEGGQLKKEPTYLQKAAHYGNDDVGNTYVEVNLTTQHLFFYKDGQLLVESDFVSGNQATSNETPTGTYAVMYKERNATLTGENYATPVDYWIPFFTDVGFHDAQWRDGFGGEIYKNDGSLGCVNMPLEAVRTIYENIEKGVGVYVYK